MTAAALQQWLAQALERHRRGELADAEALYRRIIETRPDHFDALHMLGVIRHQQGRHDEAHDLIGRALAVRPESVWALSNRGLVLAALGRSAEALAAFDQALALAPDDLEARNNRGLVLQALGRDDEALHDFEQVLAARPDFVQALNNRGNVLQALGRYEEALASYAAATARAPGFAQAHYNAGAALQALDRPAEALGAYGRALALEPDYADAHWNESLVRLSLGDFAAGWRKFEWRWRTSDAARRSPLPHPLWLGEAPLDGCSVLLHAEQGLGDAIQFVRYVPLVAARGAQVILAVHAELKRLFSDAMSDLGAAAVFGEGESLPPCHLRCPLLSLPHAFGTTLDTIPATIPYLAPSPELAAKWQARLASVPRPRVGLVWAGNPAHKNDRNRSLSLAELAPLRQLAGLGYVSLQKPGPAPGGDGLLDLGPELSDFAETAAAVAALDLIIAVDTAVAHLAGALGKPVWILLPFSADWRWLREREDSPWYPTARLFRQPRPGDWASVVGRVTAELQKFAAS